MPVTFMAFCRLWSAQVLDIRFSIHHVASPLSGPFSDAIFSIASEAAGTSMKASVSVARRRSAIESFDDRARAARPGTAAGTCRRHAIHANVFGHATGSLG